MRPRDIRRRETLDLEQEVKRLHEAIFEQRFQGKSEEKVDRGVIRKHRRDIARIRTVIRERELGMARSAAPEGRR
jgi:large subunit ribosomal protein L29